MTVQFKGQIPNDFVRTITPPRQMSDAKIEYSVAYDSYTYGEHVSPVRSVTHTGYDNDQADIPKKGTDPTTS